MAKDPDGKPYKLHPRYYALSDRIKDDRNLSSWALLAGICLLSLSQRNGFANQTNKTLAKKSGVKSVRTLQRATAELEKHAYFTVTLTKSGVKRYTPNYDLVKDVVKEKSTTEDASLYERAGTPIIETEFHEVKSEPKQDESKQNKPPPKVVDFLATMTEKVKQRRRNDG